MIKINTPGSAKAFIITKEKNLQFDYAEDGISSALENGQVVTIGDSECDYNNFKEFIVAQIFRLSLPRFIKITGWDKEELIDYLANVDPYDGIWKDDTMDYFDGVEGDY